MGTYKVIQDIEAEDKLLGPLTLKQFIFAGIALMCGYFSFLFATKGVPFMIIFFLPPMVFFGFMAWPWSREQPTEVWLLAKLRFLVKPRRRIWDQSGLKELVTITAPKHEEKTYTNGLTEGEVKSRLKALANTIDSRGWAIKNVNVNLFSQPQYALDTNSDRLIDPSILPKEVANYDVTLSDDILDEQNNPTAQNLDRMIHASSAQHREQVVSQMKQGDQQLPQDQPADYWFMNQTAASVPAGQVVFDGSATILPGVQPQSSTPTTATTPDEQALLAKLHSGKGKKRAAYGHMRTINPAGTAAQESSKSRPSADTASGAPTSPRTPDPAILELANNDDLNVATLARQASKQKENDLSDGEVVIPLR